jgi:hypothetical protein
MTRPVVIQEAPEAAVLKVFRRHTAWDGARRFCLICGGPGWPECDRCAIKHDAAMKRAEDI